MFGNFLCAVWVCLGQKNAMAWACSRVRFAPGPLTGDNPFFSLLFHTRISVFIRRLLLFFLVDLLAFQKHTSLYIDFPTPSNPCENNPANSIPIASHTSISQIVSHTTFYFARNSLICAASFTIESNKSIICGIRSRTVSRSTSISTDPLSLDFSVATRFKYAL